MMNSRIMKPAVRGATASVSQYEIFRVQNIRPKRTTNATRVLTSCQMLFRSTGSSYRATVSFQSFQESMLPDQRAGHRHLVVRRRGGCRHVPADPGAAGE